jgi:hypothetical protein
MRFDEIAAPRRLKKNITRLVKNIDKRVRPTKRVTALTPMIRACVWKLSFEI